MLDADQLWRCIRLMSCGETLSLGQHDLAVESLAKHKGFFFNRFQQLLHEINHGPRLLGHVHSMTQAAEDLLQHLENTPQMSTQDKSQIQAAEDLARGLDNGSQMFASGSGGVCAFGGGGPVPDAPHASSAWNNINVGCERIGSTERTDGGWR